MMDLAAVVKTYLELAGGFEHPLHLAQFALPKADVERLFAAWDEDYQISRFMLLSQQSTLEPASDRFVINGAECTHVTFRPGIQRLLASR